jgi:hypothetical protein
MLWGKIIRFYWKIAKYWEKMYNHFIFNSVLNLCESSYDKCHRLSFLMSQTRFVCSIGHFWAKTAVFEMKIRETVPGQ